MYDGEEEEQRCCVCQETPYLRKGVKTLYTKCGHVVCSICKNRLFEIEKSEVVRCPACRAVELTKKDFKSKTKEEIEYKTDLENRRKICRMLAWPFTKFGRYNKNLEDFKNISEYNDYLERREEIIQERIKELYTDTALKEYENTHRTEIRHNSAFIEYEKEKMREKANNEEDLLREIPLGSAVYTAILGREGVAQPMEVETENVPGTFLAPDIRIHDYDFRYIDSIYRSHPPALQLPKSHVKGIAAEIITGKSEAEKRLIICRAGGYPIEYVSGRLKKEAMDSLGL